MMIEIFRTAQNDIFRHAEPFRGICFISNFLEIEKYYIKFLLNRYIVVKWHPLNSSDLLEIHLLSKHIHQDYPEDITIFSERLRLYPAGCFVLKSTMIAGYIISHPWEYAKPPALNHLLGELPEKATTYYIHDIALSTDVSGKGFASDIVKLIEQHAWDAGFDNLSLIAVNNSAGFWQKHGFEIYSNEVSKSKLHSYDEFAQFMVKKLKN